MSFARCYSQISADEVHYQNSIAHSLAITFDSFNKSTHDRGKFFYDNNSTLISKKFYRQKSAKMRNIAKFFFFIIGITRVRFVSLSHNITTISVFLSL